jgi:putative membrane protein
LSIVRSPVSVLEALYGGLALTGFLLRLLTVSLGLWIAANIVPGIDVDDGWTLVGSALVLGLVNAVVRPVLVVLTLPLSILTLGLFLLVINAGMVALVARLLHGFHVAGFWSALACSIVVSLVSWVVSWATGPKTHVEISLLDRRF